MLLKEVRLGLKTLRKQWVLRLPRSSLNQAQMRSMSPGAVLLLLAMVRVLWWHPPCTHLEAVRIKGLDKYLASRKYHDELAANSNSKYKAIAICILGLKADDPSK